ncbi:tRNA-aminoacylation cofactor ARC1 [Carex littledalei]|uniref:tRNA-aminoacylation cofactor ARC1 n=1 Tax=Carex littledalei TaxID=544730 RepID=A0A833VFV4_9POAL|nr:tRNA-aminoacylation cofactor ARC1 [Carex littledalei]
MPSGDQLSTSTRNKAIAFALCNHLSLDASKVYAKVIEESDINGLLSSIVTPFPNQDEVMKWVEFTSKFDGKADATKPMLNTLNNDLSQKSVLVGAGYNPSVADIIVLAVIHPFLISLAKTDIQTLPHLIRWADYIQNVVDFGGLIEKIQVNRVPFTPHAASLKKNEKAEIEPASKKEATAVKNAEKPSTSGAPEKQKKATAEEKGKSKSDKKTEEKKKAPEESVAKDAECSVSLLNIQVGRILSAKKHPSADSLLVEEIDVGEGTPRQVVSGLAKYCTPEELTNRLVVLITNVKPGKLRDVMSCGLVLCASSEDHTKVEPLIPPEGAKIGERVSFAGYDGKPEDVLNPKKKQLDKITPHLYTDENGVATFKGVPFMTSAGPCTSTIPKATVK